MDDQLDIGTTKSRWEVPEFLVTTTILADCVNSESMIKVKRGQGKEIVTCICIF